MRRLGTRVRNLVGAFALMVVSSTAVVVATAGPAAADPTCTPRGVDPFTISFSCAGTDGTGTYEARIMCDVNPLTPIIPPDPFDYFVSSGRVPTSQTVTLRCNLNGVAALPTTSVQPPNVSLQCNSRLGNISCRLTYALANPVQIQWTRNGVHQPGWDGLTQISTRCISYATIRVTVSNSFWSASSLWGGCVTGNP